MDNLQCPPVSVLNLAELHFQTMYLADITLKFERNMIEYATSKNTDVGTGGPFFLQSSKG